MFGSLYFGQSYFGALVIPAPVEDTRPDCGGVFGTAIFGQPAFGGHNHCAPPSSTDSRPDCGGVFGTATFGGTYFGGHLQCNPPPPDGPTTRPNCGGIYGTATFGQAYFGGHYECNVFPPPKPVAPTDERHGGGPPPTHGQARDILDLRADRQKTAENWERSQIEADDEEVAFIIGLWLSLK